MGVYDLFLLALAGVVAGWMNAVAGGGSFILLPSLVFSGMPAVLANTTTSASLLAGYASSAWGMRETLKLLDKFGILVLLSVSTLGAIVGALLLTAMSDSIFRSLAPFLVLFATLLFVCGGAIKELAKRVRKRLMSFGRLFGVGLSSVYGGFFNGGVGIALLAILPIGTQKTDQHEIFLEANALKSLLSFVLTLVAVAVFIFADKLDLLTTVFLLVPTCLGGYLGARTLYAIPLRWSQALVVGSGLFVSAVLFVTQ